MAWYGAAEPGRKEAGGPRETERNRADDRVTISACLRLIGCRLLRAR